MVDREQEKEARRPVDLHGVRRAGEEHERVVGSACEQGGNGLSFRPLRSAA